MSGLAAHETLAHPAATTTSGAPGEDHGWRVTLAGMGINLALGVLYAWSVLSRGIPAEWGWSEADKALPYSVACLVFSLVMVPAGRLQDRLGPRLVATVGGVLVGCGTIVASFCTTPLGYVLGFGLLAGAGIGCGYASATPPAVKWFPAARTGLIAGLVVAGFGLANVYVSPLANALIGHYGVGRTMLVFGIGFLVIVVGLAQLLQAPPAGYVPRAAPSAAGRTPVAAAAARVDFTPGQLLRTRQFYLLWFVYACAAGAGLMIISKLAKMVDVQAGLQLGFVLVAVLGIGNGGGRVLAGLLSDRIGRKATLLIAFLLQALCIFTLSLGSAQNLLGSLGVMALLSALIGANYGANLALFPALTKDWFGLTHFGVNYGLVFTAWGLGGFTLSLLAGQAYDRTHSFTFAYYGSAALLLVAAAVALAIRPPRAPR